MQYCNPFVIAFPRPYGENPVLSNPPLMSEVDSCACNQFTALSTAASTAAYTPSSLNRYLDSVYHDTLTQVAYKGLFFKPRL